MPNQRTRRRRKQQNSPRAAAESEPTSPGTSLLTAKNCDQRDASDHASIGQSLSTASTITRISTSVADLAVKSPVTSSPTGSNVPVRSSSEARLHTSVADAVDDTLLSRDDVSSHGDLAGVAAASDAPPADPHALAKRLLDDIAQAPAAQGRMVTFRNSGLDCAYISGLQALLAVPPFQVFMSRLHTVSDVVFNLGGETLQALASLQASIEANSGSTPLPLSSFEAVIDCFKASIIQASNNQQDALEFMDFVCEQVNNELHQLRQNLDCSKGGEANRESDWNEVVKNKRVVLKGQNAANEQQFSGFARCFQGTMISTLKAWGRSHSMPSKTVECFSYLPLPVRLGNRTDKPIRTVTHALEVYCRHETISGVRLGSSSCGVTATKTTQFGVLPEVLIVQLLRFGKDGEKLLHPVRYDSELHIPLDVLTPDHREAVRYQLASVVVHMGSDSGAGHYMTYARYGASWHCFNDASMERVDPRIVFGQIAYVLVYCRRQT